MSRKSYEIRNDIQYEENIATAMWAIGNDSAAEAAEHRVEILRQELKAVEI